jgi:hypothetical protein
MNSYQITLPDDVFQQQDERVSSFWRPGSHSALQLSSYVREAGPQVSAEQRLNERIAKGDSKAAPLKGFQTDWCPESAAATVIDGRGWTWTHVYLVWPDLAVYATVSRPPYEDSSADSWAIQAVKGIRRTSTN